MKVLHTSDWHVGKGLGRFSRQKELEAALGEMANLVEDQQVDMVLMAGDLFDKKRPDDEAIGVALRGLIRLTLGGKVPVVAIAGNHDKDRLIENLSEVMELHRVYMVGTVRPPGAALAG